jgi:hypothetical protein
VGIRILDLYFCGPTLVVVSPYLGYHLHYMDYGILDPSTLASTLGRKGQAGVGEDVGEDKLGG